jgi:hypothetical protein
LGGLSWIQGSTSTFLWLLRSKFFSMGDYFIFQRCVGANKITWATIACFCDYFWTNIHSTFLKYSWKTFQKNL